MEGLGHGHHVAPAKLTIAVAALQDDGRPDGIALAGPLVDWLSQRPIASKQLGVTLEDRADGTEWTIER